jgi:hypothetical protein
MSDLADAQGPPSSGVTEESLKQKLVEKLEATHVEVKDVSGTTAGKCTRIRD